MDPQYFRMAGAPLRYIIMTAYGLDDFQLTGLPDWAAHEFFTISATTDAPTTPDQMLLMLRRLLAERFQLQIEEGEKETSSVGHRGSTQRSQTQAARGRRELPARHLGR